MQYAQTIQIKFLLYRDSTFKHIIDAQYCNNTGVMKNN